MKEYINLSKKETEKLIRNCMAVFTRSNFSKSPNPKYNYVQLDKEAFLELLNEQYEESATFSFEASATNLILFF